MSHTDVEIPAGLPPVGAVLVGKYRVDRLLGHGGMGYVIAATHIQLEEPVAIKFLLGPLVNDRELVSRFIREAKAARKIKSEHVVRILDVAALDDGTPYMVMELLEGTDLDKLLRDKGRQPVALSIDYLLQAGEALAEAHVQGTVHRDLKPGNLFLTKGADGDPLVKLLDFGISKVSGTAATNLAITATNTLFGSPLYMAPEHMRSIRDVDTRSDIWALGVILYELLSGTTPFGGTSLAELCSALLDAPAPHIRERHPEIPEAVERAILRCLEKDRAKRFPNIAELAHALAPFGSASARASATRIAGVFAAAQTALRASSPPRVEPTKPMPARTSAMPPVSARTPRSRPTPSPPTPMPGSPRSSGWPSPSALSPPPGTAPPGISGSTTVKSWGRESTPVPPLPPKASTPTVIAAAVTGLAIVAAVVVLVVVPALRSAVAQAKHDPPAPSESVSAPPPPPPVVVVVDAAPPEPEPALVVDAAVEETAVEAGVPDAGAALAAPAPRPKVDCTVPYDFDANGRKRWKRECI